MAHPKRKTSKQRKHKRRTHQKLDGVSVATCSNCSASVQSHRACTECGYYRGRKVLEV